MSTLPGPNARPETYQTIVYVLGKLAHTVAAIDVDAAAALVDAGVVPATEEERRMLDGAADFRAAVLGDGPTAAAELHRAARWIGENAPEDIGEGGNVVDVLLRLAERGKRARRPTKKAAPAKAAS